MSTISQPTSNTNLFAGNAEVSRLMQTRDWSATPLGPASHWPQSLKIALRIMLDSRYAMWLGWGPELTFLYNDAYARMTLGAKHPWALGRSAREVWAEIWNDIGPRAESVIRSGQATWDERLLLFLERLGFPEETYHTFSYSPVPDDHGGVGGMLCVVTEDTEEVIGERRLRTLRELAARTNEAAKSAEEACQTAARTLAANPYDLPFALLYLIDADGRTARLAGPTGLPQNLPSAAVCVDLTAPAGAANNWPLRSVMESGRAEVIQDLDASLAHLQIGVWPEPPHAAAVLPVRKSGQEQLAGFLVAGLSPRRPFDDNYRGFLDLVAGQIASDLANARAYEEERRRAEALAELDRAKTTFFSNVSHEFRTPLTLMLGPVEDILAKPTNGVMPDNRELLEVVRRNGLRLQKLVNTLLDFSRLEAGRVQASYEPTDLAGLTAELASNFRSACEQAGLKFVVDCSPLPEPVYVDREMWEKIVLNLVSNAFKYTLAGGIEVALHLHRQAVELAVRDTGTGIPADQLPHLFERFHRVEGAQGRTQEGSGIGLALVRELVRLHGGEVHVESQVGLGSTFRVTIPLGSAHLPPERIRAARSLASTALGAAAYVEEALRWLPEDDQVTRWQGDKVTESDLSSPWHSIAVSSSRPHILLADDNADMRDYVRRLLSGQYDVTAVTDGVAAREAIRRRVPDLVLSDVMMPRLDGFGLLKELRGDPRTQALPVILLSARAGEEARVEGLQAGADDYVTKPFSARELLARVGSALEIARLRREALARERRLLAEVEEQRNWLKVTLASIGDAVIATDTAGRTQFLNPVAQTLTGWTDAEARGRPLDEIFAITNEATGQPVESPVARVLRDGQIVGLANHTVLTGRDGTRRPIDDSAAPIKAADGRTLGVVLVFRDVTERRGTEEEIRRLNRDLQRRVTEFQTLLDVIPIGIAVAEDAACQRIWSNPSMARLLRLPTGDNISLSAPSEERPAYRVFDNGRELTPDELPLQTVVATGREVRGIKHDILLPDGAWVSLLHYAVPLYDEAGRVRGGLYAGVDITEQARAQQAIRETERRFRAAFNQQFQFMAILAPDGTVLEANDTCFTATGVSREQTLGRHFWDTPWWASLPAMQQWWKQSISSALQSNGPVAGEVDYNMADGSLRHAAVVLTGLKDEGGQVTMLIVEGRDDTDRRQAQDALRRSEQRWRMMAEALPNLVWTDLPSGECDWLSSQWGKYTGIPENELLGLRWLEKVIHPDDRARTLACWEAACADQADYDLEYRIRRHDGQYRWFKTRGVPMRDEHGRIIYWFGTCTDIEDHKQAEAALREADRRKDEFLATLAHELRNPLAPIRNALQILKLPRVDPATANRSREMMERQVQHLVRLVDDLLDVSRVMRGKITLHRERVELATIVARAVETAQPLIEAQGHDLSVTMPPESLPVDADPVRLAQVVGNLLTNAAKYTEPGGRIELRAERQDREVVLRVRDTGIGIAPEMLPKIFDLFVQVDHAATKSQGGLGIGLTLVRNLVEMHRGTVQVHSAGLGMGSEFVVRLPLMDQETATPKQPCEQGWTPASSGRRLLVVDDNQDAADSLAVLLRLQGHEVEVAHDGAAALELAQDYRPEIVFLDLGMPGMDGYEVARRLRQQPGLEQVRLAALTGWGQQEDRRRTAAAGFDHHLVKPVEPDLLQQLLGS
ncbi:MAG TPA: ATP-binding protein [Gemmataceae bacterium]|nr:ATP-binding protein [Gemmataceae bacterium]